MVKGKFEERIENFEWKRKMKKKKLENDMYGLNFQPNIYQKHKELLF
jgi:hypothetical protein